MAKKLDKTITTCCPECGATFKTEYDRETCINCSNRFNTQENQILIGNEDELDTPD
jgi:predicted  nucleic acid-binding Zn-ribbon protein